MRVWQIIPRIEPLKRNDTKPDIFWKDVIGASNIISLEFKYKLGPEAGLIY